MQPHILIDRLASYFILPDQILLLFFKFLTECSVSPITCSTDSPQGCVLSPLLFIMYTDSCKASQEGSHLVKSSDDTALLSLPQDTQLDHGLALNDFIKWCDDNFLDLNVRKTKELIIDFRNNSAEPKKSQIHGEPVGIVETYKYLGTIFDSDKNTESLVKQGQQRIHLMHKLNSVSKTILCSFYHSFIESFNVLFHL